jgi:hypothetical protein
VIFWILLWLVSALAYPLGSGVREPNYIESLARQFIFSFGKIALTYWSIYFLFPRFFIKRRYVAFTCWFIISLLAATAIQRLINFNFYYPHIYIRLVSVRDDLNLDYWDFTPIVQTVLILYPPAIIALFAKAVKQWYHSQNRLKEMEKEQLYAELKYLQAQIHPHFFFNTLNNLYGLVRMQAEEAPSIILKLSSLMRYMLYETNVTKVALKTECSHLLEYIELEKIRYKDGFDILFKQRGDINNTFLPPLLLLPFIENAFKHGFGESVQNAWISIDLEVKDKNLYFRIENSVPLTMVKKSPGTGLGIPNARRRLELLYQNNYQLKIKEGEGSYAVELVIPVE